MGPAVCACVCVVRTRRDGGACDDVDGSMGVGVGVGCPGQARPGQAVVRLGSDRCRVLPCFAKIGEYLT